MMLALSLLRRSRCVLYLSRLAYACGVNSLADGGVCPFVQQIHNIWLLLLRLSSIIILDFVAES